MPMKSVSLANLEEIGLDSVAELFKRELTRAVRDLYDRPGDKGERKVVLEWRLKPRVDQMGVCDGAFGQIVAYCALPKQKTRAYAFAASASGQLAFRPDSPDEPNQTTFEDLGNDESEDEKEIS